MGWTLKRVGVAVASLVGALGCAHPRLSQPPAVPGEVRAQVGTVGVTSARFAPGTELWRPNTEGAAAASGAAQGLGLGVLGGAVCFLSLGHVGDACVVAIATPVLMVMGASTGAEKGVPAPKLEDAEASIKAVLGDPRIQEAMRDSLIATARDQTPARLVPLAEHGPVTDAEPVGAPIRAIPGVDSLLEVSVMHLGLRYAYPSHSRARSFWTLARELDSSVERNVNPPLEFTMSVRVRLKRVEDGTTLYSHTFEYRGYPRVFTAWGENDAESLRAELASAFQSLAGQIVQALFLAEASGGSPTSQAGKS